MPHRGRTQLVKSSYNNSHTDQGHKDEKIIIGKSQTRGHGYSGYYPHRVDCHCKKLLSVLCKCNNLLFDRFNGPLLEILFGELSRVVSKSIKTRGAMAVIMGNGNVIAWGGAGAGGDTSGVVPQGVIEIVSTEYAFCALKEDGTIVTWGDPNMGGTAPIGITDVIEVKSTRGAFCAITNNREVISWGDSDYGGNSSGVGDITNVYSTEYLFFSIKRDNTIVSWGRPSTIDGEFDVDKIFISNNIVVVIRKDGTIVGHTTGLFYKFNIDKFTSWMGKDYQVYFNLSACVVLNKNTRKMYAFGIPNLGGDISHIPDETRIANIYHNRSTFAAITMQGGLIAWGDPFRGGNASSITTQDCEKIISFRESYLVILSNGSIYGWGMNVWGHRDAHIWADTKRTLREYYPRDVYTIVSTDTKFGIYHKIGRTLYILGNIAPKSDVSCVFSNDKFILWINGEQKLMKIS